MALLDNFPFKLEIIVGENFPKRQFISKLATKPQEAYSACTSIEELKLIQIVLNESDDNETVDIIWNKIYSDEKPEFAFQFSLKKEAPYYTIPGTNRPEEYPWRIGKYLFEINYKAQTYYGSFEVLPKNIDSIQYAHMHELINEKVKGLAIDFFEHKMSFESEVQLESKNYWHFMQWFKKIKSKLFYALREIEYFSQYDLKKEYKLEKTPRQIDHRSIQLSISLKGIRHGENHYYNRKFIASMNIEPNKLVKYKIIKLITLFEQAISLAENHLEYEEASIIRIREKKKDIEAQLSSNKARKMDNKNERILKNTIKRHNKEIEKIEKSINRILAIVETLSKNKKEIKSIINNEFWFPIEFTTPKRFINGSSLPYRIINEIFRDATTVFDNKANNKKELISPVHLPTPLLYEFYVYFYLMQCFEEFDMEYGDENIKNQLATSFNQNGLKDGTKVTLIKEEVKIEVIFNEMVEPTAGSALKTETNFFQNNADKRKPDIRVDAYKLDHNKWRYNSTMIFEVKYSPLNNIYDSSVATRAMTQMDDYRGMKYVYPDKSYNYQPVYEVYCVYPHSQHKTLLASDSGLFLKLPPTAEETEGKKIIKNKFEEWLPELNW